MPSDPELQQRGRLVRSLGRWREMLPGSLVVRHRKCGKSNCRCAQGQNLHPQFQLSVLVQGQPKAIHIPAHRVEQVRRWVEMRQRFEQAASVWRGRKRQEKQWLSQEVNELTVSDSNRKGTPDLQSARERCGAKEVYGNGVGDG